MARFLGLVGDWNKGFSLYIFQGWLSHLANKIIKALDVYILKKK